MKILFTIVIAFFTTSAFSQTIIAVAFAKIKVNNKCVSKTCLPDYEIVSGPIAGTKYSREAKEALEKKYGEQYKNSDLFIDVTNNSSSSYGSFLTILSANISDDNGCKRFLYGVGFGNDKEESLKNAEKYLKGSAWNGGKKFSYKIVKQEMINGTTEDISSEKTSGESTNENGGMGKLKRKS